jgi:hypothetical protein
MAMVDALPAINAKGATTLTDAKPRTGHPVLGFSKWLYRLPATSR